MKASGRIVLSDMHEMHSNPHFQAIQEFYGESRSKRSNIPLMNHIEEGLILLQGLGASQDAKEAFCLHPMVQADEDLKTFIGSNSLAQKFAFNQRALVLALEYRAVANGYLSKHFKGPGDIITLSCLEEVNDMLRADKIQNKKDFELYHQASHERAEGLVIYFENWLAALGISARKYQDLSSSIKSPAK